MTKITQLISGGTYRLVKYLRSHSSKVKAQKKKKVKAQTDQGNCLKSHNSHMEAQRCWATFLRSQSSVMEAEWSGNLPS